MEQVRSSAVRLEEITATMKQFCACVRPPRKHLYNEQGFRDLLQLLFTYYDEETRRWRRFQGYGSGWWLSPWLILFQTVLFILADVFSEILLGIGVVPFLFVIYGEIPRVVAVLFYTINKNVFLGLTIKYKYYVVDQKIQRPFLKICGTFYDNIKDLN